MSMSDKLFGTYTQRNKKRINDIVKEICSLEDKYKSMSDSELSSQTDIFRKRLVKLKKILWLKHSQFVEKQLEDV